MASGKKKRSGDRIGSLEESVAAASAKFGSIERVMLDAHNEIAVRDHTIGELRVKVADLEERAEQARVIAAKALETRDLEREAGNAMIRRQREKLAERDEALSARDLVICQQNGVIAKRDSEIVELTRVIETDREEIERLKVIVRANAGE